MTLPRAVTVVGLGLIGGSLCRALRERVPEIRITGIDSDPSTVTAALGDGVCDSAGDADELLDGATLVVLCTPIDAVPVWLEACSVRCPDALVTDSGSTKRWIVDRAGDLPGLRFLGGHPMAGGERGGYAMSSAALFDGCTWVLTPATDADLEAFAAWREALGAIGAHEEVMTAGEHDRAAALASHLPLMLSSAMVATVVESPGWSRAQRITAGTFRDVARPAGSDPQLLASIATTNRDALVDALDAASVQLAEIRALVERGDETGLRAAFAVARDARRDWLTRRERDGRPVR